MITFENPGCIDMRGLTNFGMSSKAEGDIGRFGTGWKYATAVILRHGGSISVWNGSEWLQISSRADNFRGKEIHQATINGKDLPFTTDLGRDWELWMAFRELYANALDEGGNVFRHEVRPDGLDENCTCIAVSLDAFEAIFFTMEEHFIGRDEEPIYASDKMDVYAGRSPFVFYRGIAIQKLKEPAQFRYNLKGHISLTEDRTAKYSWQVQNHIASGILECTNPEIVDKATDQRSAYEATIDFSDVSEKPSDLFLGSASKKGANCNPTAMAVVRAQLPADTSTATILAKGAPGAECLSKALSVLRALDADLSKAKFVLAEGMQIFGNFDVKGDAVYLSQDIFDNQDKMNLACLLGYAEVIGNEWAGRKLISIAKREVSQ